MNSIWNRFIWVLAVAVLAGCDGEVGNVPGPYRGVFVENPTGTKLELKRSDVKLDVEGMSFAAKVSLLSYEVLLKGDPGFYIAQNKDEPKMVDVFWVVPDLSTRKEEAGLIYYNAELVYMKIDANQKEKVSSIHLIHSRNGQVLLDTSTQQWQMGWPPNPTEHTLIRTSG